MQSLGTMAKLSIAEIQFGEVPIVCTLSQKCFRDRLVEYFTTIFKREDFKRYNVDGGTVVIQYLVISYQCNSVASPIRCWVGSVGLDRIDLLV